MNRTRGTAIITPGRHVVSIDTDPIDYSDPDVFDAFIAVEDEFVRIADTYVDNDGNPLCAGDAG